MQDHRGFSLVEALVAIGILAGGLLGLAHVLNAAVGAGIASRNVTAATVMAAQKVEELRSAVDIAGSTDYLDSSGAVVGVDTTPAGAIYRRRWTVELLAVPGAPRVIHVHVEPLASAAGAAAARHEAAHVVAVLAGTRP